MFKIAIIALWSALLLVGACLWVVGFGTKRPALNKAGGLTLLCWLAYDLVILVLAFALGWFK